VDNAVEKSVDNAEPTWTTRDRTVHRPVDNPRIVISNARLTCSNADLEAVDENFLA
jgi:hypothetical protein